MAQAPPRDESAAGDTQPATLPSVVVATLSWNRKIHTLEWLESLSRTDCGNYRVLVVDQGSRDGSVDAVRARFPDAEIIENGRNLGYSRGFNVAMEHAFGQGADYVLIMNNDAVIDPETVKELVAVAEMDPRNGFVSGKVYHYFRPEEFQTVGTNTHPYLISGSQIGGGEIDRGQYDEIAERELTDDMFLLIRRAVWERVGGFDPDYGLYGHDNIDWCLRVRKAGFKIMYAPKAKIWHKGRAGGGWTAFYVYNQVKTDYILIAKHTKFPKVLASTALLLFWYQPKWMLLRVRPTKLSQIKSYLGGQFDGIRWMLGMGRKEQREGHLRSDDAPYSAT
jgi:hypothetical protein